MPSGPGEPGGLHWIASYPKSGNTWLRVFLTNLLADGDAPADINALGTGGIASARSWLDDVLGFDTADLDHAEAERVRPAVYRWAAAQGRTGYHKVHDAYTRLPDGKPLLGGAGTAGVVYVVRNPLDVAPSYAHHLGITADRAIGHMASDAHRLAASTDRPHAQVRQRLLSWSNHVLSWVDAPELACHVVRYEDMQADPLAAFAGVARFLHLPDDPARVARAVRFSGFGELRRQEQAKGFRERPRSSAAFFREGRSGGWRTALDADQVARVVVAHGAVMRRFGYLDGRGEPV